MDMDKGKRLGLRRKTKDIRRKTKDESLGRRIKDKGIDMYRDKNKRRQKTEDKRQKIKEKYKNKAKRQKENR